MSQPTPRMNLSGAVDLSSLARPAGPPAAGPAGSPGSAGGAGRGTVEGPLVVDVTEATFGTTVQLSQQVPVVLELWSPRSGASGQLAEVLRTLVTEYGGRFQLARVDVDASPQIAAALQVQAVPTVAAIIGGQPVPLFQGVYPAEQLRQVLDEVLRLAAQNGVTGVLTGGEAPAEPEEPPLPPLHAEALEAIDRGDLEAAERAYQQAIKENPGDGEARAALLQLGLIRRVEAAGDPSEILAAAEQAGPKDVDAQLAAADVEAAGGSFGPAFERLLAVVRVTAGDDRDRARVRLVELFDIAGPHHPDVGPARRQLASALY